MPYRINPFTGQLDDLGLDYTIQTSDPGTNTDYPVPFLWYNSTDGTYWLQTESGVWVLIAGSSGPGWQNATLTTTDATTTNIVAIALSSSTVVNLEARISAGLADESTGYVARIFAGANRSSGGSSSLISTAVVDELESMTGSPTVTVDVNSNTLRIRATGVAATTINWSLWYQTFVHSA